MNSPNKSATISVADFLFFSIFSNASYPELAFLKKIGVNWILMDLIGVKIPNSPEVVWWGDDVAAPETVEGFGSCGVGIPLCI